MPVTAKLIRKSALRQVFQSLEGVVYGPDGAPLGDAAVRLPGVNRSTQTSRYGEFKFEAVPVIAVKQLLVEAQGRQMVIDLSSLSASWPLAIHFQLEE
ncbi:MAG: carboxypeptidase regulatory-like domain-containing protein [Acidobacteria bacterium]|nr:carboxypeptidase regulatory-like domain-containing protein [Acidobacteriota bacterium]